MLIRLIRCAKQVVHEGIDVKKSENFSRWYIQAINKAELLDYYSVSGCYVLRPWAYSIWETIQSFLNAELKKLSIQNCYFPMFIQADTLKLEEAHIADFSSEVAWVTMAGTRKLERPLAIRPTSETVIYPIFSRWCKSQKLPIKINQWCNVVRWEHQQPPFPFLRSREFLWQEGHTAYETQDEAITEVYKIIDLYERVYNDLLAIPVVKGRKSEKEKFPGCDFTTTVEAYVPENGRAIQCATSHHLGQNFSKIFDISFANPENKGQKEYAWQNSWGLSTRAIGAMVMIHGDDIGLVLPPRIAPIQVVVMPVAIRTKEGHAEERRKILEKANEIANNLREQAGLRVEADLRENVYSGKKFYHWERKGIPLRIEIGPRELKQNQVVAVIRHNGEKRLIEMSRMNEEVTKILEEIHHEMFKKVEKKRDENIRICLDWDQFTPLLNQKMLLLSPFCGHPECEKRIKDQSTREEPVEEGIPIMGAKTLCIPLEQPTRLALDQCCIHPDCSAKAEFFALFGRSY